MIHQNLMLLWPKVAKNDSEQLQNLSSQNTVKSQTKIIKDILGIL